MSRSISSRHFRAPRHRAQNTTARRSRLLLEALEGRTLPATVNWINPLGGDWSVPENWSTGALPGPDDDVVIDVPGSITVTHSSGLDLVRSLTSAETLAMSGGSLGLAETSAVNAPLTFSDGTLSGPGTLTVGGMFLWTGGTLAGTGRTVAGGGLEIGGTASKVIDGRTVENAAAATWTAGNVTLANGASLHNRAGGTFLARAGASLIHRTPGVPTAFHNAGAFTSARSTTLDNVQFFNTGTVLVRPELAEDITLTVKGSGNSTGRFQADPRGTLRFSSGPHQFQAGSQVTGAGAVEFRYEGSEGVNVTVAGTYAVTGTTRVGSQGGFVAGAIVNFLADASLGTLDISAGTIRGSGNLTITNAFTWTGGWLAGRGRMALQGTTTIAGGETKTLDERILDNAGTTTWASGSAGVTFVNGAVFNNQTGATFDAQSGSFFGGFPADLRNQFNNAGTLRRSGATGTSTFTISLSSLGRIDVTGGTLALSETSTLTGPVSVLEGATFQFTGTSFHHVRPTARISGGGTVRYSGNGIVEVEGDYALTGETVVENGVGGVVRLRRDVTLSRLTLQLNGILEGPSNLTIAGLFTWDSGVLRGPGRTRANGGIVSRFPGARPVLIGGTFDNPGEVTWNISGLGLEEGAVFNNLEKAVFTVTVNSNAGIGGNGTFNNLGTVVLDRSTATVTGTFRNTGVVDLRGARLEVYGTSHNSGVYNLGGLVRFGWGTHTLTTDSQLTGTGTVEFHAQTGTNLTNISGEYDVGRTVIGRAIVNFLVDARTTNMELNGDTLYTMGTLTVEGRLTWNAGTFGGSGTLRVMDRFVGYGAVLMGGRVEVAGQASFDGGTYTFGNGAVLSVLPGASFDVQYDSRISALAGLTPRIVNAGTLRKVNGTGPITFVGIALDNSGTVEVQQGTLSLSGGGTNTGNFIVPAGSTLTFNSGRHTLGQTTRISGAGTVRFADDRRVFGSAAILEGSLETTGPVSVADTVLDLRRDTRVASLTLAGSVAGFANLNITGMFTWTTGTLGGRGQVVAEGGMSVTGDFGSQYILEGRQLDNAGLATWSPLRGLIARNGGVFTNRAGATFDYQRVDTIHGGGDSFFRNAGLLRYAQIQNGRWSIPLHNTGRVEIVSGAGSLELAVGGFSSGTITVAQGTTLQFSSPGFELRPGSQFTSQGQVVLNSGTMTVAGLFDITRFIGGFESVLQVEANARIADASFYIAAVAAPATLTVTNTISWSTLRGPGRIVFGGRSSWFGMGTLLLDGVTFDNAGTITLIGTTATTGFAARNGATFNNLDGATLEFQRLGRFRWDLVGTVPRFNNAGRLLKSMDQGNVEISITFTNTGVVEVQTGTLSLTGPFSNFSGTTLTGGRYVVRGTLRFNNADIRTNAAAIVLDGPAARIVNESSANALANLFRNAAAGQIAFESGHVLSTVRPFQNAGQMSILGGSLFLTDGDYTQTGGTTRLDGGSLVAAGGVNLEGGVLSGSGYVFGDVVNAAQLDVGGAGAAGRLTIFGNYTQAAEGVLSLELGDLDAGDYDVLDITGTASLDGTLSVALLDSFFAREGDIFAMLLSAGAEGQFAALDLPDLGAELFLEPYFDGTGFYLIVFRRP